jgi:hypothetical protein
VWAALGSGLLFFTKPCRAVRCQYLISTTVRPCALTNSAMPGIGHSDRSPSVCHSDTATQACLLRSCGSFRTNASRRGSGETVNRMLPREVMTVCRRSLETLWDVTDMTRGQGGRQPAPRRSARDPNLLVAPALSKVSCPQRDNGDKFGRLRRDRKTAERTSTVSRFRINPARACVFLPAPPALRPSRDFN